MGNSEGGSNVLSREEFNTAIGDLSAKLESLMMTMSQVVHGTAPAATGDGGESRGGRAFESRNRRKGGEEAGTRVCRYGRKRRGEADEAKEKEASKGRS